jgi:hypothetical protein
MIVIWLSNSSLYWMVFFLLIKCNHRVETSQYCAAASSAALCFINHYFTYCWYNQSAIRVIHTDVHFLLHFARCWNAIHNLINLPTFIRSFIGHCCRSIITSSQDILDQLAIEHFMVCFNSAIQSMSTWVQVWFAWRPFGHTKRLWTDVFGSL